MWRSRSKQSPKAPYHTVELSLTDLHKASRGDNEDPFCNWSPPIGTLLQESPEVDINHNHHDNHKHHSSMTTAKKFSQYNSSN